MLGFTNTIPIDDNSNSEYPIDETYQQDVNKLKHNIYNTVHCSYFLFVNTETSQFRFYKCYYNLRKRYFYLLFSNVNDVITCFLITV